MIERRPIRYAVESLRHARRAARWAAGKNASILIEIRWRLGDEIMMLPIYEGLKARHPSSHLAVWCNYPDLLAGNPYVDRVFGPDVTPIEREYDMFMLLRGARRDEVRLEHTARVARIPPPTTAPRLYYDDWRSELLEREGLVGKPFVVVSTGATWATKRWPIAHWRRLCGALADAGHTVVQIGSEADRRAGAAHDFAGRTTVREAACILRRARLLVSCDSGPMHLALAVGTPVLALFGPTDPAMLVHETAPLTAITNGRPCHGCWNHSRDEMKEGVCPLGIAGCMSTIAPETVAACARGLLDGCDARKPT